MSIASPSLTASHPLRNENFRRWWIGFGISAFGDQFYLVALPWVILQLTGSAVSMGTILMLAASPRTVLMLMGGAFSDRISPRRIMIATASARTILVTAISCLLWAHTLQLWHLYLLAFAFGIADAFSYPASQTFLPSLVLPEQLLAANSVSQATMQFSWIVGPAVAGLVVRALGAAWAFFLDAVSFLFIIIALWRLPDPPAVTHINKYNLWQSMTDGLSYVRRDKALLTFALLSAMLNLSIIGPITVGLADLAKVRFTSPTAYGLWVSSFSVGGLIGSLLASRHKQQKRGLLLLRVCASVGVGIAGIGWLRNIWFIAVMLLLIGGALGFVNVHMEAWSQQRVDRAMLGRVMSVLMLAAFGLMPISLFVAGVLAQWNLSMLYLISGLSLLLTVGLAGLNRVVREI